MDIISSLYQNFSSWFWECHFWLGEKICWEDIQPTPEFKYPAFHDPFIYPLLIAAVIVLLNKYIFTPYIFSYIAVLSGVKNCRKNPEPNLSLEQLYLSAKKNPHPKAISESSIKIGWSERQVERWLRQRKRVNLPSKYDKFLDCELVCTFHIFMTIYGWYTLYNKPWLFNISECWENWPHHEITDDVWWFYMTGMAFYWALMFIQVPQPGRKDKIPMIIHHTLTIYLMGLSWIINHVRIGTLVLIVHEGVDILLLTGKMIKYAKGHPLLTDVVFGLFIILWCILRLGFYPFWVMKSVYYEAHVIFRPSTYTFFMGLLWFLMSLNLMWTFMIFKIAIQKLLGGEVQDIRSDDEDSDEVHNKDKKDE